MKCPECGYYQVKSYYAKLEEQNARFLKNFLGNDVLYHLKVITCR